VSWSPIDAFLFASASDDHTVKIWGMDNCKAQIKCLEDCKKVKYQLLEENQNQIQESEGEDLDDVEEEEEDEEST